MSLLRSSQISSSLVSESAAPEGAVTRPNASEHGPIRVVIAISAELERIAWGIIIGNQTDMQLIGQVASCDEALALLETNGSDVTLIDEAVLDTDKYESLLKYTNRPSSSRFVLVAPHQLDYSLKQSQYAFAQAHLLKGVSADELLTAIRQSADHRAS
jgi:DNA-binding NarL/FixJ family response regulator